MAQHHPHAISKIDLGELKGTLTDSYGYESEEIDWGDR